MPGSSRAPLEGWGLPVSRSRLPERLWHLLSQQTLNPEEAWPDNGKSQNRGAVTALREPTVTSWSPARWRWGRVEHPYRHSLRKSGPVTSSTSAWYTRRE